MPDRGRRRTGRTTTSSAWHGVSAGMALGAVAVVAVLALAGLAAGSGSWASAPASSTGSSWSPPSASFTPRTWPADKSPAPAPPRMPAERSELSGYVVFGFAVLLVVGLLALLARRLRSARRFLRRGWWRSSAARGRTDVAPDPAELPQAVDRALRAVEVPDAREAVVQAWLLLCAAAAAAGTPARASETAEEYGRRLAAVHRLPVPSLQRLAELYREARFSAHPVRPEQRNQARAELETLRAALVEPDRTAAR